MHRREQIASGDDGNSILGEEEEKWNEEIELHKTTDLMHFTRKRPELFITNIYKQIIFVFLCCMLASYAPLKVRKEWVCL